MRKNKKIAKTISILFIVCTFFAAVGAYTADGWEKTEKGWMFYKDGQAVSGWISDEGKLYYLKDTGEMVTGWLCDYDVWYYMQDSGAATIGWLELNGSRYHFDENGAMDTGWTKVDGKYYYFYTAGVMAKSMELDGWVIGSSGTARKEGESPIEGITIGIDPGHQAKGNSDKEAAAPNSSEMKAKVTSGAQGAYSGTSEHEINLKVGLALKQKLEDEGAKVVMTRTTADVDISNQERAKMMNNAKADLVIRLHCDGADSSSAHGVSVLTPTGDYTKSIESASYRAAEHILREFVAETGANNRGISKRSDQTGFNWSTVPVVNVEMGFLSNKAEDTKLNTADYQNKCAQGILNGIIAYFE